jgi:nicotinamide-nucleotide amidase
MFHLDNINSASFILKTCSEQNLLIAVAESCTGGLIAGCLTEVTGSSRVFDCGFVTYSNEAKNSVLQVPLKIIDEYGAVSKEVSCAMAEGALQKSRADIAIACTGVAGPSGGTDAKPIGLVHIACLLKNNGLSHKHYNFGGNRNTIRTSTVAAALQLIIDKLKSRDIRNHTL